MKGQSVILNCQDDYRFEESLKLLGRSPIEVTHHVKDGRVRKWLPLSRPLLVQVNPVEAGLQLTALSDVRNAEHLEEAARYVEMWLGLQVNIEGFYQLTEGDDLLRPLAQDYRGLRIVQIPELFEALSWAIMGQQINLTFAYTLKKRFVERYGEGMAYQGEMYWQFPKPEDVVNVSVEELQELQLTRRKAEYILGVAKLMITGELEKAQLESLSDDGLRQRLLAIRGIGPWTADYVSMRCFGRTSAFPIGDAGLHQAVRKHLNLDRKPTVKELETLGARWQGWQSYATYYLWRSLSTN
ncbi:DNA-3-methyladenine glycosylase family protein [Chryseomicrobium excrementi]|uniref:DNA-3-methyladenine glycosylase family protein n=1 Tax=Chryseomicrobium excrementi TaxID=2041346 RepID=UPI0010556FB8|nr:DNA-3-methyladenine glycosylase [Chryseomicrobium excrementi]